MRFLSIIAAIFIAGLCGTAFAQTKTVETKTTKDTVTGKTTTTVDTIISETEDVRHINNAITVNPLKFFLFYNLTYYRALSPSLAFGIGAQIPTLHDLGGFGLNGELRFYPSEKSLRGFYIAPNVSYTHITYTFSTYDISGNASSSSDGSGTSTSIGVLIGWQWFPGDEFAIGLGIGVDYYFLSAGVGGSSVDFGSLGNGTVPALRFDIGYGWK
jgi:hypothetical protein